MSADKLKSEVTASRPRDEKGHFISSPDYKSAKTPIEKFIYSHTGNYKDQEDLLDIRIGNPLRKVIELLEEIKKQKAFSFTFKGSLGIAGVLMFLSVFGLFGGNKVICEKGNQSIVGYVKILNFREIYTDKVGIIDHVLNIIAVPQKKITKRTILLTDSVGSTIYLPYNKDIDFIKYSNNLVVVTGKYNSCSNSLMIESAEGIERATE